jgi:hypothetical protein
MATPSTIIKCGRFQCIIVRNTSGNMSWLCGYIALPPGHPWHGLGYDDVDATVHGGLTFASPADECHFAGVPVESWVLGFDCAHYGDGMFGEASPRGEAYVTSELANLSAQAEAAS